jgi:hypothetical protein
MERDHSIFGPSSASIWLNCTPAARFGAKFEKKSSDYADEGTLCHDIAADLLNYRLKRLSKREYLVNLAAHRSHRLYDPFEMERHAEAFVNYVLEILYLYQQKGWADIYVETRVDYSHVVQEGYGHLDVAIISPKTIDVIDLKYGKGVPVSAIVNPQLGLYAIGVIEDQRFIDEFEKLNLHIFQPRIDNISVFNTTVQECIKWAQGTVKKKAALAFKGEGDFNAGSWCRFCAALPKCKTAADRHTSLAKLDFKLPYELDNDEVAEVLLLGETLVNWYTSVKEYATAEARKGAKFPGFKMVNGKSNRRYAEGKQEDIIKALKKAGYTDDQIKKSSLLGIGEMEKLLGDAGFTKLLGKYVVKPPGAPALVPETDRRSAMHGKAGAQNDFKTVKIKK